MFPDDADEAEEGEVVAAEEVVVVAEEGVPRRVRRRRRMYGCGCRGPRFRGQGTLARSLPPGDRPRTCHAYLAKKVLKLMSSD